MSIFTPGIIETLCKRYADVDGYRNPKHFECRYDDESTRICYSLIRHYQPRRVLAIGTWRGGSTCMILSALLKNGFLFSYLASELYPEMRQETAKHALEVCFQSPQMMAEIQSLGKLPPGLLWDFLFIDTDHDRETTEWIVKNIFPHLYSGALVAIHDWAVEEKEGKWVGKGQEGMGATEETQYLMELHQEDKLPLQPLFWNYDPTRNWSPEASFWIYKPL